MSKNTNGQPSQFFFWQKNSNQIMNMTQPFFHSNSLQDSGAPTHLTVHSVATQRAHHLHANFHGGRYESQQLAINQRDEEEGGSYPMMLQGESSFSVGVFEPTNPIPIEVKKSVNVHQ